jgi:hypothetical protein
MVHTDDEFEACANVIDGAQCGSKEWALVPMPDADLTLTRDDRRYLRSIRIDPDV